MNDPKVTGPLSEKQQITNDNTTHVLGAISGVELVRMMKLLLSSVVTGEINVVKGYVIRDDGTSRSTASVSWRSISLEQADELFSLVIQRHVTFDNATNQKYELHLIYNNDPTGATNAPTSSPGKSGTSRGRRNRRHRRGKSPDR